MDTVEFTRNVGVVEKIIGTFPESRMKAVQRMFEDIGEQFYTAPASTREDFHGCFPGGLCDHSLRVIQQLRKVSGVFSKDRYMMHELDFLGLVHDLGKVGNGEKPLYIPNPSDWHRNKGMLYEINKDIPYMPISDRTMYLLQKYEIVLSEEEWLAVRLSDGQYEESNRRYGMKEPDLALLLHWADRWACSLEKSA